MARVRVVVPWLVAIAAALGSSGCNSPTLPLPPPSLPDVSAAGEGKVHLASTRGVEPNAIVILFNRNPAVPLDLRVTGVQADGEGSWAQTITASHGDVIDLSEEFGTLQSPSTTFRVP